MSSKRNLLNILKVPGDIVSIIFYYYYSPIENGPLIELNKSLTKQVIEFLSYANMLNKINVNVDYPEYVFISFLRDNNRIFFKLGCEIYN
jgi:hypothetical protein